MTPRQQEIIDLARQCVGTPFHHQGRNPLVGVDCAGLVLYPAFVLGLIEKDTANYGRLPQPDLMLAEILRLGGKEVPKSEMQPADVLWLDVKGEPQHLALYTGPTIIHALADGPKRVVEHGFRPPWPGRVRRVFRYPHLEEV